MTAHNAAESDAPSLLPVNLGDTVAGKFRVEAILGQGAMGVVVRATHVELETTFAIKFLLNKSKGEAERRFLREGRIASKLKSLHAAKVVDVGLHAGAPFLVMEYLEGEDLAALLEREGPLSVENAVVYVLQACEALAEAHAMGITHRDVKPANLMLTKGAAGAPCVKVLDFGVSKAVGALGAAGTEEGRLTRTTQMLGSPLYMAPEQVSDAVNADGRADVWSIGVVLYELLTGTTPWTGTSILGLLTSMVKDPLTPIAKFRADVPNGLCAVITQCLEKDRSRRWRNIAEFAAALAPYGPEPAEFVVQRIASSHRLPAPEIARPTEPMPAPGEVSSFGWFGNTPAAESRVERPLLGDSPAVESRVQRRLLPSRPDAGPVAMPARTSVASVATTESAVGNARVLRGMAIGVPIAAAVVIIAILGLRWATREPQPVAGPVALPVQTPEGPRSSAPEPSVQAAPGTTAAPSTAPPATVPTSTATTRTKVSPRPVAAQPPLATKGADLPDGPRH